MFRLCSLMALVALLGCGGEGREGGERGRSRIGDEGRDAAQAQQLEADQAMIERAIRSEHAGGNPKITGWGEPVPYYAALMGRAGQEGYSGISMVSSRAEAEASVERFNEVERNLHSPGEPLLVELKLKGLEQVGWQIDVEYEAGLGSDLTYYTDNYLVYDTVMLINGELRRDQRQAICQGSSSRSADSTIRSGR